MKKRYIIVMDLDGTLLSEDSTYKGFSRDYFKQLKEQGNIIVIATGRTLERTAKVLGNFDFMDYIIVNSGAAIYEVSSKKFIYLKEINKQEINKILPILNTKSEKFQLRDLYGCQYIQDNNYTDELEKMDIITMLVMDLKKQSELNEILKLLQNTTNKISFNIMQDSFGDNKWFNILAPNVSKFTTIEWLRKKLEIDFDHVITFGDGLNDLEMLGNYEIGVAVGNALPEVKKVAKYIADKNQEEGVLSFLKDFFKNEINTTFN